MEKGAIALLDVLGWQGIWRRDKDAIAKLLMLRDTAKNAKEGLVAGKYGSLMPQGTKVEAEVLSISDTLAFTVYGEPFAAVQLASLLTVTTILRSLENGIPIRGAICYGEMQSKENILIGPAVDEVASWYEQCNWIGAILSPSCKIYIDPTHFKNPKLFERWDVPSKVGVLHNSLALNWPEWWAVGEASLDAKFKLLKDALLTLGPITPEISTKIESTLEFATKFMGPVRPEENSSD